MCYISCASFGGILSWQKYWHPIFPTMWVTWVLPRPTGNRKMSSPLTLPWQVTNFALWTYNFVKARSNILFIFPYSKFWPVHFISSDFSVLPFWHSFWHLCSHSFWHSFLAFIPFFLWNGRCRTSTASASGFEIYNMLFLNLRKNSVGNLECCNSVVICVFFAVHQCAFWNVNLRFFLCSPVHRCGFWNNQLCFFMVTSVLLLVRTFQGKRKQNNDCFRRFSFGFTLLRDFWAT